MGTLAAQRWGDMSKDVEAVWKPMQAQLFAEAATTEAKALELSKAKKDAELKKFLTDYSQKWGTTVVDRAWLLGDELWTKYDEKF